MTPEAKLAAFAEHIHLQEEDVNYLISLLQEARGLGSIAGSAAEREACAKIAEQWATPQTLPLDCGPVQVSGFGRPIADAIRAECAKDAKAWVEEAIRLAVAVEREACAKLVDQFSKECRDDALVIEADTAESIAKEIRARENA